MGKSLYIRPLTSRILALLSSDGTRGCNASGPAWYLFPMLPGLLTSNSGSTDASVQFARNMGVDVVLLDTAIPFTAARARNAGFKRLQERIRDLRYVQFVDGDCEKVDGWITQAVSFLEATPNTAIVCGRLRERHPENSIYNWMCDREWDGPIGEIKASGGNFIVSAKAFQSVGGFRADLIAGENSDLCIRIRQQGWKIWRIEAEMALHDSAMTSISQWLRRSVRGGYAFAQGAHIHGVGPERHWVWEARRAMIWGFYLPLGIIALSTFLNPWLHLAWLLYPAQLIRQTVRNTGTLKARLTLALFQLVGRFPEAWGQLKFLFNRFLNREALIIEHK